MEPQARIAELEAEVAAKDAVIAALTQQVAALLKRVEELEERLNRNSRNSNLPPSSDRPGSTGPSGTKKTSTTRKRGGQPGHRGRHRELVPEDQVDEFVDLFPSKCENCWASLPEAPDPEPKRHQHTELPQVETHTIEFRRHTVGCSRCGHKTCAAYDSNKIPASPFGPRLMSVVALLTGVYHVSRRQAVSLLSDVLGIELSLGALSGIEARVSEAVAPAVTEAWHQVRDAPVKQYRWDRLAQERDIALAVDDRDDDGHSVQNRLHR